MKHEIEKVIVLGPAYLPSEFLLQGSRNEELAIAAAVLYELLGGTGINVRRAAYGGNHPGFPGKHQIGRKGLEGIGSVEGRGVRTACLACKIARQGCAVVIAGGISPVLVVIPVVDEHSEVPGLHSRLASGIEIEIDAQVRQGERASVGTEAAVIAVRQRGCGSRKLRTLGRAGRYVQARRHRNLRKAAHGTAGRVYGYGCDVPARCRHCISQGKGSRGARIVIRRIPEGVIHILGSELQRQQGKARYYRVLFHIVGINLVCIALSASSG